MITSDVIVPLNVTPQMLQMLRKRTTNPHERHTQVREEGYQMKGIQTLVRALYAL
jgi:hypothetical protein